MAGSHSRWSQLLDLMSTSVAEAHSPAREAIGPKRQNEIYLAGALGRKPIVPADVEALERQAQLGLPPENFAYVAGGAGTEATMRANREAFAKWPIRPRMMRNVSQRDLATPLFRRTLAHPLLLAPIGVQDLAHPGGDLATARACAAENVPMIFSNQASVPMEDLAAVMGDRPRWMQLYWSKSDDLVESFARRAEACGCEAIVVTLDTTILGWRARDLDQAFLPFIQGKGIAQYTSDPVFRAMLKEPPEADMQAAALLFISIYSNPALTWDKLAFLRERTELPILVKGIQREDDARKALDHGVDGIIVSNHGGRQVDGAIGALDALAPVVQAVGGAVPVLFDSGIRTGADMFKAMALGASAVLLGRPYVYGLAIAGEEGVRAVIRNLLADFDLTMGLSGCRNIGEITRDTIVGT